MRQHLKFLSGSRNDCIMKDNLVILAQYLLDYLKILNLKQHLSHQDTPQLTT